MEDQETPQNGEIQPDVPEAEAVQPEAAEPAAAAAEAPEAEAAQPEASESDVAEPEATEAAPADVTMDELLAAEPAPLLPLEDAQLQAVIEAVIYVSEEPLTLAQLAASLRQPADRVRGLLRQLMAEFEKPEHGIAIREVAGGFKMATKPEHHESVRGFVKSLKPPLKLSLPALETLAVIAYKQPVTGPEIQEVRGVQGTGVLKTLLDRKLIAAAGRKNVIGKPILYKTTKEFLVQFGLKDLAELPSLKEFEEIRRLALTDEPTPAEGTGRPAAPVEESAAAPGETAPAAEAVEPAAEASPEPSPEPAPEPAAAEPAAEVPAEEA